MTDSDSEPKSRDTPSSELDDASPYPKSQPPISNSEATEDRETILSQARKFLEEEGVKNADTSKKIEFLESKGLQSSEIDNLLGISRNAEASASPAPSTPPTATQTPIPVSPTKLQAQSRSEPSGPPIITYPEFLAVPPAPANPPLITTPRLARVLTAFSTLSVLLYGTSHYLVNPMVEDLTRARGELAGRALQGVEKLNRLLAERVSEVPTSTRHKKELEEGDSEDEDPSEMFHRDIGVQTSLPGSPSRFDSDAENKSESTAIDSQTSRLTSLRSSLSEMLDTSTQEGYETAELEGTISVLREYLDSMAFATPSYGGSSYGLYGGGYGSGNGKEDDEISRVKAGIRGVKGVLLSARSFPGGMGRVAAGGR